MTATEYTVKKYLDGGSRVVEAVIVADSTPSALPTNGKGVEGLLESDTFYPMSILYVVGDASVYLANEEGKFVKQ